jgi:hypothetical protein
VWRAAVGDLLLEAFAPLLFAVSVLDVCGVAFSLFEFGLIRCARERHAVTPHASNTSTACVPA